MPYSIVVSIQCDLVGVQTEEVVCCVIIVSADCDLCGVSTEEAVCCVINC